MGIQFQKTDVEGQLKYSDSASLRWMKVKPLGTIAACFPYVDDETRSILQSIMIKAKDYNEFADSLCERVAKETSPPLLNYFAYFHAFNQQKFNLVRELETKVAVPNLARPLVLLTHPWGNIDWDDFQKPIAEALKDAPNDWIACHIYMMWREEIDSMQTYPERFTDLEPLRILESKIEHDEDFSFFLTFLYHIKARNYQREAKIDESKTWYDRAVTIANLNDDLAMVAVLLFNKANMIKNVNFDEALSILNSQKLVSEEIGCAHALGLNDLALGFIAQARGEYETAVKHLEKHVGYFEPLGVYSWVDFHRLVIALQYNHMRNGTRALEIVHDVLKGYQSLSPWFPYLQQTWALLNLEQLDKAAQILDLARNQPPRSGSNQDLGWIHFLDGLLFKKRGDFLSAKFELEQAYALFGAFPGNNWPLIQLVDVEIEKFSYRKENANADVSGPWMQRLMELVKEKDLPGIEAQALLLEAKFRFKQGSTSDAEKLVKKVLKTSKTYGMNYLKSMAQSLLPELLIS